MAEATQLRTDRLQLRPWRDSDRAPFAAMCADPAVMEFLLPVPDRTASDALLDRLQAGISARGWGFWALELRSTQAFIGFTGIQVPGSALPFSPCVEIGWRLATAHWGQGYATEAARTALAFGFEALELPEIVAFTTLHNQRSQAVMQRLGMQAEPESFDHPAVPPRHPLREHRLYRLARQHWVNR
ncbi:GNAT family N-acetyltransferase [Rhodoferax sp.]|uniref:GNAT family N-acetyltransferase n=1 Tax=Rhodoferax sp. TaxID=50421 RepID=UPI00374D3F4C